MPRRGTRGPAAEPEEPVEEAVADAEERESDTGGGSAACVSDAGAAGGAVVDEEDESEAGSEPAVEQAAAWADLVDAEVLNAAADHHFAQPVIAAGMADAAQAVLGQPAQPLPLVHTACRVSFSHFLWPKGQPIVDLVAARSAWLQRSCRRTSGGPRNWSWCLR